MIVLELIAISDLYGDERVLRELLPVLNKTEKDNRIAIVAGDIALNAVSPGYYNEVKKILLSLAEYMAHVFYVPGDSDAHDLNFSADNVTNLDKRHYLLKSGNLKIGLIGLGGAPKHSVRVGEPLTYLWDENIQVVADGLKSELKIQLEKVMLERPDYLVLVTHAPPYGVADRSMLISLNEILALEEILQDAGLRMVREEQEKPRIARNPRHLGSKVIGEFAKYYKPDLHIFGHVHKQGGKADSEGWTKSFNVSHLSPIPYKLTGRKFLYMRLERKGIDWHFESVVVKNLPFHDFIEAYL